MTFISIRFLIFFIAILMVLFLLKNESKKQIVLLLASYLFYILFDYRFLIILIFQTCVAYFFGKKITKTKNGKMYLTVAIVISLCVLGLFKYYNFFVSSFCDLFQITNSSTLKIILPIGISFYTLQAISYLIDVYQEKVKNNKGFIKIALFIGFFPQLTSGPILKAHDFLPQLDIEHHINKLQIVEGLQMFLFGLVKKIVIADRLAVCVNAVYSAPAAYSAASLVCAAIAYSIQIYCDFSGYSDMAIGLARMMGYDLGKNFNAPYIASNVSEFWSRWHISLSSWFKEYVYFPLGGNRKGKNRTYLNLFLVMILSGFWHGANWTFLVWGALYGLASIVHKIFLEITEKYNLKLKNQKLIVFNKMLSIFGTFVFVTICWIFFRANDLSTAFLIIYRIITFADGISYIYVYTIIYGFVVLVGHLYVLLRKHGKSNYIFLNYNKFSSWLILWLVILFTLALFYAGDTAFIYSQF